MPGLRTEKQAREKVEQLNEQIYRYERLVTSLQREIDELRNQLSLRRPAFQEAMMYARLGDDDEVMRILRSMDRQERKEFIDACEYAKTTAQMMQRGSNRL